MYRYSTTVAQRRLPSAATVVCGPHCDWSPYWPRKKKQNKNKNTHIMTQTQKCEGETAEMTWDFIFTQRTMTSVLLLKVVLKGWWSSFSQQVERSRSRSPSEFPRLILPCLHTLHSSSPFPDPTSLLYATTQMPALFPMMNESLFSAYLSCLAVVCPCWRNNLPFPVFTDQKGHLRSRAKKWIWEQQENLGI